MLRAIPAGKIKENPFKVYKVGKYVHGEREWLDLDEIQKLKTLWENKHKIPTKLHSTLIHFLHCCHCGLRAIDSRSFDVHTHVRGGYIMLMPSKSEGHKLQKLKVPINDYCRYLHGEIANYSLKVNFDDIGRDLVDICKEVGITKHITFHCARHSFAINSLIVGVPIEVVSKWLGHMDLGTTQIYARVVDVLSEAQMSKWNSAVTGEAIHHYEDHAGRVFLSLYKTEYPDKAAAILALQQVIDALTAV